MEPILRRSHRHGSRGHRTAPSFRAQLRLRRHRMMAPPGTIITFYSYKGSVGRSMGLANVGILLSQWGYRTLLIDFDLEAPGLEFFFLDTFGSAASAFELEGTLEVLTYAFG